jgi:hypothetical protein
MRISERGVLMSGASIRRLTRALRHLCSACSAQRARYQYRGVVRADRHHTLCFRCFRAERDRQRARLLADPRGMVGEGASSTYGAWDITKAATATDNDRGQVCAFSAHSLGYALSLPEIRQRNCGRDVRNISRHSDLSASTIRPVLNFSLNPQ